MAIHLKSTGVDFADLSNLGGMAQELLDDYEAGTFTPSMAGINVNGATAFYVHIAKLVSVKTFMVAGGAGNGQTNAVIGSLPYTADGGQYNYGHDTVLTDQLDHAYGHVAGQMAPGTTNFTLIVSSHIVNAHSGLTLDHFTSSSDIRASLSYVSA
jgi:hypothetical protein